MSTAHRRGRSGFLEDHPAVHKATGAMYECEAGLVVAGQEATLAPARRSSPTLMWPSPTWAGPRLRWRPHQRLRDLNPAQAVVAQTSAEAALRVTRIRLFARSEQSAEPVGENFAPRVAHGP
jgi:hypothetical protein